MSETLLRLLLVLGVLAASVTVARLWPRVRAWRRARRTIDPEGLGPWPAVLLFTAPSCAACGPTRELVREATGSRGVREVSFEEEPEVFAAKRVDAVPLVVVVDSGGRVTAQFAGIPDRAALRRAVRRIG